MKELERVDADASFARTWTGLQAATILTTVEVIGTTGEERRGQKGTTVLPTGLLTATDPMMLVLAIVTALLPFM